jgi:cyclophilin family peptidyl-prolyl cis-trans isomerase
VSAAAAGCYPVPWHGARALPHPAPDIKENPFMKRVLLLAVLAGALAAAPARAANPVVVVETSAGTIKIELYPDKAPATVKNFLGYVEDKFYDDTIFHRVMGKENTRDKEDFMIQGGGFTTDRKEKKTKDPIKNEADNGLSNKRGTVAMARTNDPDSATAQFFINVKDNNFLDKNNRSAGYAVFGKVTEGMDVVDKIKAVKTGSKKFTVKSGQEAPFDNVPEEDVVIKKITVEKPK